MYVSASVCERVCVRKERESRNWEDGLTRTEGRTASNRKLEGMDWNRGITFPLQSLLAVLFCGLVLQSGGI